MPTLEQLFAKADENREIKRKSFWITSATLFGLAIISVLGRFFIKRKYKLRFDVDDYFVFYATVCLIVGTAFLYQEVDNLYIGPILSKDPSMISAIPPERMQKIFDYGMIHQHIYFTLLWSSIFGVKFAFLAFFRKMIHRMKAMQVYWWVTLSILIPAWAAIVIMGFFLCPRFGAAAVYCAKHPKNRFYEQMMITHGVLDATTDLMIVSIPILILRKVMLPTRQKVIVGAFLCLSLTMIVITLVRSAKIFSKVTRTIDIRWAVFWVHVEASIAVLMVSLTSFRTAFNVKRNRDTDRERLWKYSRNVMRTFGFSKSSGKSSSGLEVEIPGGKMTGARTMFDKGTFGESAIELSHTDPYRQSSTEGVHIPGRGHGTASSSLEERSVRLNGSVL